MQQRPEDMHPDDKRNMILFIVLSLILWLSYDHFVLKPQQVLLQKQEAMAQKTAAIQAPDTTISETNTPQNRLSVLTAQPRLFLQNDNITGSLSLKGSRFDDISLLKYFQTVKGKDPVILLSPAKTDHVFFNETGWLSLDKAINVPNQDTIWQPDTPDAAIIANKPVTLSWDNGQGLIFYRDITLDDHFMVHVKQRVANHTGKTITLFPYALVNEQNLQDEQLTRSVAHEGLIAYLNHDLEEVRYAKMAKMATKKNALPSGQATQGWIGITHKYWLNAIVPTQGQAFDVQFKYQNNATPKVAGRPAPYREGQYQVDLRGQAIEIPTGKTGSSEFNIFMGVKKIDLLEKYEKSLKIPHFDLAVDFGLWYFLTKPFFHALNFVYGFVGNFGIALILFCMALRLLMFPMANMSFKSFAKLRQISPQMTEMRQKYGHDKPKLQQEIMKLYEREKVNPMAGCLPILIQIPVFFSLYKVLSITIEMRHAPFFGWIQDLSAPDPTNIFTLFGLIDWNVPSFLHIGAWPLVMMVTLILQQRLNPKSQDPSQAQAMAMMPYFMTYLLSNFAAGLVIYWSVSNLLSSLQQYVIMRSMGVKVSLWGRDEDADKKVEKQ